VQSLDERALVWAVGRDATLTGNFLSRAGFHPHLCQDAAELCQEITNGVGVLIMAGELLRSGANQQIRDVLAKQPPWSDIPVLVIATPPFAGASTTDRTLSELLTDFGDVSVLHRPLSLDTLFSTVAAALRARRRQYQVRELLRQREDNERRREEFLAMLAHELRNPLAPIRTGLQVLRLTDSPEIAAKTRQMMERQVANLSRLVDDLLDVSRITRGTIALKKQVVNVVDALRQVTDSRARIAREHGVAVELEAPAADRPLFVSADPTRLEQMIDNVLTNALKFTPRGGKVQLRAALEEGEVVIRVRDTGIGIPAHMLEQVFELFRQTERPLDRSQGGLGIGLTVVRTLAELHGGSVRALSDGEGMGTEMVIRLPALTQGATEQAERERYERGAGVARKVLIVEDNRDAADVLATYLRSCGHSVRVAYDGSEGFEAALRERPEVVICDIGLPGMDGFEFARTLRAHPELRQALLVAVTGYGETRDRERGVQAGFEHYIVKPADPERIAMLLNSVREARAPPN
jgi:signal transduction histidine kinase/ActR/RegA family two-component response regulator